MSTRNIGSITTAYEVWSPEDIEHGEAGERGWISEMGDEIDPDKDNYDDYRDFYEEHDASDDDIHDEVVVAMALEYLEEEGATESSNSDFSVGTWYTMYGIADFETGEIENRSYFLEDFTPKQEAMIFEGMQE